LQPFALKTGSISITRVETFFFTLPVPCPSRRCVATFVPVHLPADNSLRVARVRRVSLNNHPPAMVGKLHDGPSVRPLTRVYTRQQGSGNRRCRPLKRRSTRPWCPHTTQASVSTAMVSTSWFAAAQRKVLTPASSLIQRTTSKCPGCRETPCPATVMLNSGFAFARTSTLYNGIAPSSLRLLGSAPASSSILLARFQVSLILAEPTRRVEQ